jgi:hypothetical protein
MIIKKLFEYDNQDQRIEDFLLENCMPFLKKHANDVLKMNNCLARVIDTSIDNYQVMRTQANRNPRDTPQFFSEKIEDFLKNKFGHNYRRNHIAFSYLHGSSYLSSYDGGTYCIVPIDEYDMVTSDDVADLYYLINNAEHTKKILKKYANSDYAKDINFVNQIVSELGKNKAGWTEEAIIQEILIAYFMIFDRRSVDGFKLESIVRTQMLNTLRYILDVDFLTEEQNGLLNDICEYLVNNIDALCDDLFEQCDYYKVEKLTDIKPDREIMIHCKQYVAINMDAKEFISMLDRLMKENNL